MSNHTPGPWKIGEGSWVTSNHPVPEINGSDHLEFYGGHLIAESIAPQNLAIIAAAPCTHAAALPFVAEENHLKFMGDKDGRIYLSVTKEEFEAMKSAIAKATGKESE